MAIAIRDAKLIDLESVVETYHSAIGPKLCASGITPITAEPRPDWITTTTRDRPIWVAEVDNGNTRNIAGYLSFSNFMNDRPGYAITADMGLYLHKQFDCHGVAAALLKKAIEFAPSAGIETFSATIFASNTASVNLFKSFGFKQWGYMPEVARLDGMKKDLVLVGLQLS